jgi:hypothetical protein
MRHARLAFLTGLALITASAAPLAAQRTRASSTSSTQPAAWELGTDAALSFGLDTPKITTLGIPIGMLRAGILATDVMEIEPFFMLNHVSVQNGGSGTVYQFGSGLLYHFSPDRMKSQLYVRPFLSVIGSSGGGASNSDVGAGVGVGMKWPMMNGRFAWRGEGNFTAVNGNNSINLMWGLSYFTR